MNKDGKKNGKRHCVSDAQKKAIRRYYAVKRAKERQQQQGRVEAEYPHFRYYKKSQHPALITGEQVNEKKQDEYNYRKVMHSEKDGKRNNEKIEPNPNPRDSKPMYIGRRTRHDVKSNFDEKPLPWKYPKK